MLSGYEDYIKKTLWWTAQSPHDQQCTKESTILPGVASTFQVAVSCAFCRFVYSSNYSLRVQWHFPAGGSASVCTQQWLQTGDGMQTGRPCWHAFIFCWTGSGEKIFVESDQFLFLRGGSAAQPKMISLVEFYRNTMLRIEPKNHLSWLSRVEPFFKCGILSQSMMTHVSTVAPQKETATLSHAAVVLLRSPSNHSFVLF